MEKVKNSILLALLCLYFVKAIMQPSGYQDAAILLILGGLVSFFEFKSSDTKLSLIEKQMVKLSEDIEMRNKEVDSLKSAVASMKLAQGMRGLGSNAPR